MRGKEQKGKIYIIRTKDKAGAYKYSNVVKKLSASAKKAELKIKNIKGDYPCSELFGKDIKSRIREVLDERDILGEIKGERSVWVFLNETILSPLGLVYIIHILLAVFIAAVFKPAFEIFNNVPESMLEQDISNWYIFILALLFLIIVFIVIPFIPITLFDRFVRGILFNAYENEDFLLWWRKFISIILAPILALAAIIVMLIWPIFLFVIIAFLIIDFFYSFTRKIFFNDYIKKLAFSLWMRKEIICVILALAATIVMLIWPIFLFVIIAFLIIDFFYSLTRKKFFNDRVKDFIKKISSKFIDPKFSEATLVVKLRKKLSKNYVKYRKYKRTYDIFIKFLLVYILLKVMDTMLNYSNSLHETANQLL